MGIEIALAALLILLVWYVWYDSRSKEHMISEADVATISRGFNVPLAPDYEAIPVLAGAERASHTTDVILS